MGRNRKTGLTKTAIEGILSEYRLQKNEFKYLEGFESITYESIRLKGYMVSFSEEELPQGGKTGRVIVTHTRTDGKISLYDIWERDGDGKLQFRFRNPKNTPPADTGYIRDLEEENKRLREAGQKLQGTLLATDNNNKQVLNHKLNNENPGEVQRLRAEVLNLKKIK